MNHNNRQILANPEQPAQKVSTDYVRADLVGAPSTLLMVSTSSGCCSSDPTDGVQLMNVSRVNSATFSADSPETTLLHMPFFYFFIPNINRK